MAKKPIVSTSSTGSSQSLDIAIEWIETCTREHSLCRSVRQKSDPNQLWLPTRLLELEPGTTHDADQKVSLKEELDGAQGAQYATLTYCRGDATFKTLTTTSPTEFKSGLPVSTLPRTFREAIEVTQLLGLRYLWIDALCILQNAEQDWLYEGMTMSNLYTYSYINLCASSALDGEGGLFCKRDPSILNGCEVEISWEGVEKGKYICMPLNPRQQKMTSSPLNNRAWAVQETLLSSRTIHFASDQLYWDCCETRCSESHPEEQSWGNKLTRDLEIKKEFGELRNGKDMTKENIMAMWWSILREYTLGKLTKPSDKLMAISGVAQVIHALCPEEDYLAGIWRSDLLLSLMWRLYPNRNEKSRRFDTYVAPSWSWASIEGRVNASRPMPMFKNDTKYLVDILEAKTTPVAGPLGPVSGGHIKLRARMTPITVSSTSDFCDIGPTSLHIDGHRLCKWYVIPASDDEERPLGHWSDLFIIQFAHDSLAPKWRDEERAANKKRGRHIGLRGVSKGLILKPTGVKGQFERVGHWESRVWKEYAQITDYLKRNEVLEDTDLAWVLLRGFHDHSVVDDALRSGKVEDRFYEEFDGRDRYTFTII